MQAFDRDSKLPEERVSLLLDLGAPPQKVTLDEMPPETQVCNCNGVTKAGIGSCVAAGSRAATSVMKATCCARWTARQRCCSTPAASCSITVSTRSTRIAPIPLPNGWAWNASARWCWRTATGSSPPWTRCWKNPLPTLSTRGRSGRSRGRPISSAPFWQERNEMSGERAIGHLSQILLGEGRNFGVDGMVSFSHLQGWPVRHPAELPASPGPAGGWLLGGTTLVCPLHETPFDLRTGEAVAGSYPLRTY